jgi:hypothetical protein
MALAILKYLERSGGHHVFEADIGTNIYYQYKTGKSKRKHKGLEVVDDVNHQSALLKHPVSDPRNFNTRFVFKIPENAFNKDNRFIQLFSYKAQNQISPAMSDVIAVLPSIGDLNDDLKLPKIMTLTHTNGNGSGIHAQYAPCHIQEKKVSEAMFFNALLGALPNILTNALPMISKIIPGLQKALPVVGKLLPELSKIIPKDVKPGQEGLNQVLQNISPETLKAIVEVIQGLTAKTDNTAAINGQAQAKSILRYSHDFSINPATLMQLAPLLEKVLTPETIRAIGDNPVQLFKAIADSALKLQKMDLDHLENMNSGLNGSRLDKTVQGMALRSRSGRYSEAKIAPALLAALPALMPVLEKVLSPDMINAIGEQPVKLFNAISDAGLKLSKQELDHLEKINPGVDDPGFDSIVNSMSVKTSVSVKAKFSDAYSIEFTDVKTIVVAGKDRVVYDRKQRIHIPVKVMTSGKTNGEKLTHIPKGIFQLIIQDGDSMKVLLQKKFKLKDVTIGSSIQDITLDSDELKRLPLNKDLKLELTFNWKKGDKIQGTFRNHYIWVSDGYLYQRTGNNIKQHFALSDVSKFRNYWHKVWEGGPETHARWKVEFECKYYYQLNEKDATIKKLETKKKTVSDSAAKPDEGDYRRKITGKLKSGMEISLAAYNELLSQHQLTPLNPAQLTAFIGQDFVKESATAARASVDFKGKKGETAALWAYPEGNIQSYVLGKATTVSPSGMITAAQEEEVFFPRFSTIHFIGTKSE